VPNWLFFVVLVGVAWGLFALITVAVLATSRRKSRKDTEDQPEA
jgi:hypothetical protein